MTERVRLESGTLELRGEAWFLAWVRPQLDLAVRRREKRAGFQDRDGYRTWCKLEPMAWRTGLRHGLRALWPGIGVPRLQEFENLTWLRRNGFHAPPPLAAGCVRNALGLPTYQFLFTQDVPGARTLREVFAGDPSPLGRRALDALGREVARLHGRGFVHRDLFPRNLLVTEEKSGIAIHFLDAWRGGPYPGLRGAAYDLACLMLFGVDLFDPAEQDLLFHAYFGERERLGHRVRRDRLLAAAARQRRALWKGFARRRRLGSALAVPSEEWVPRG